MIQAVRVGVIGRFRSTVAAKIPQNDPVASGYEGVDLGAKVLVGGAESGAEEDGGSIAVYFGVDTHTVLISNHRHQESRSNRSQSASAI